MSLQTNSDSQFNFENYNILIVDDNPANLRVLIDYLQSFGFGIRVARSGKTALQRVQYSRPDVILLDILMPEMDGLETCRHLKTDETTKDIPVIFMTSLTSLEDKVKGFEIGAVDYVSKPLHQEEVLARLKIHLRGQDLRMGLQEKNRQLALSSRVEQERLFEVVNQQRLQLRALNQKLTVMQEAERKQLARELHDEMGQALTAISINLSAIAQALPTDCDPDINERLAESTLLTHQTLEQIRELSFNLRPTTLDDLGLVSALQSYLKLYAKRVNIETDFEAINLEERLSPAIETALYRIVQEALTNVARHAEATKVSLLLRRQKSVFVYIEDNGRGFDMEEIAKREGVEGGIGLVGMRERVILLGGKINIESAPRHGAQLTIEIPLEQENGNNKSATGGRPYHRS